jgi:hypothetical protein
MVESQGGMLALLEGFVREVRLAHVLSSHGEHVAHELEKAAIEMRVALHEVLNA